MFLAGSTTQSNLRVLAQWRVRGASFSVVFCVLVGIVGTAALHYDLLARYGTQDLWDWRWHCLGGLSLMETVLAWSMLVASRWGRRLTALLALSLVMLPTGMLAAHVFAWRLQTDYLRLYETAGYMDLISDVAKHGIERLEAESRLLARLHARAPDLVAFSHVAKWGTLFVVLLPWVIATYASASACAVVERRRPDR